MPYKPRPWSVDYFHRPSPTYAFTRIGTVTIEEPFEGNEYGSYAADWSTWLLDAGTYDVWTSANRGWVAAIIPATLVRTWYGDTNKPGTRGEYTLERRDYTFPTAALAGGPFEFMGGVFTPVPELAWETPRRVDHSYENAYGEWVEHAPSYNLSPDTSACQTMRAHSHHSIVRAGRVGGPVTW